jgi:hypothetical protein
MVTSAEWEEQEHINHYNDTYAAWKVIDSEALQRDMKFVKLT